MTDRIKTKVIIYATDQWTLSIQSEWLVKQKDEIDEIVIIKPNNISNLNGYIRMIMCEYPTLFKTEDITIHKTDTYESAISRYISNKCNDEFVFYFIVTPEICFIQDNTIKSLRDYILSHSSVKIVLPACINSERSFYIHQVMGHSPSILLKEWDCFYIDSYNIDNFNPHLSAKIHEDFLDVAENEDWRKIKFGPYFIQPLERIPKYSFAWIGGCLNSINPYLSFDSLIKDNKSVILGDCFVSMYSQKSAKEYLGNRLDLIERYSKLPYKSPKINGYVSVDSDYQSGLYLNTLFDYSSIKYGNSPVKFVISSHISMYEYTIPKLLDSLIKTNSISPDNILVVIGGAEEETIEINKGVTYAYVTHNSYDHTAFITIFEKNFTGDYWFALHDTCSVGPDFHNNVKSKLGSPECVCVLKDGWLNMGLFRSDFINSHKDYILSLKNCNKMQAILSETLYGRMGETDYYDKVPNIKQVGFEDVYGDGVERLIMYFSEMDMYKYQSYHFKSNNTKNLIHKYLVSENDLENIDNVSG